jgi:quercetin dioxygenase-like cupin family protein
MSNDREIDVDRLGRDSALFRRRVVELAPDQELRLEAEAWRDAIVFLTAGEIELECGSGERHRFGRGAILCLAQLRLSVVRNSGGAPVVLLAISRRAAEPPRTSSG